MPELILDFPISPVRRAPHEASLRRLTPRVVASQEHEVLRCPCGVDERLVALEWSPPGCQARAAPQARAPHHPAAPHTSCGPQEDGLGQQRAGLAHLFPREVSLRPREVPLRTPAWAARLFCGGGAAAAQLSATSGRTLLCTYLVDTGMGMICLLHAGGAAGGHLRRHGVRVDAGALRGRGRAAGLRHQRVARPGRIPGRRRALCAAPHFMTGSMQGPVSNWRMPMIMGHGQAALQVSCKHYKQYCAFIQVLQKADMHQNEVFGRLHDCFAGVLASGPVRYCSKQPRTLRPHRRRQPITRLPFIQAPWAVRSGCAVAVGAIALAVAAPAQPRGRRRRRRAERRGRSGRRSGRLRRRGGGALRAPLPAGRRPALGAAGRAGGRGRLAAGHPGGAPRRACWQSPAASCVQGGAGCHRHIWIGSPLCGPAAVCSTSA